MRHARVVRRRVTWLTAMAIVASALAACGDSGTSASPQTTAGVTQTTLPAASAPTTVRDPIKLKFLPTTESLSVLPLLHAMDMGYFQQEGIDLQYLPVLANAAQAAQSVVTGQSDITDAGSTGIVATVGAGLGVVSIGVLTKEPSIVLSLNNDTIQKLAAQGITPTSPISARVQALKGLKLALTAPGSSTDIVVRATLREFGVAEKDVQLQPIADGPTAVAAAKQGQVDGYAFSPPTGYLAKTQGWGQTWIDYLKGDDPAVKGMPIIDIVTSKSYLDKNSEAVTRFMRALWRGVQDIQTQPETARASVKKRWFPDLDETLYNTTFDSVLKAFSTGLVPDEQGYQTLLKIYNSSTDKPVNLQFQQLYDSTIAQATKPKG